ncbi:MAG TPA: tripartite tricarboxylate transporter TctB family protein [Ramlibacter sp.]|nr:tripartite tricarboxylate transporter TctB family protein [Ramlibacter sp.]
MESAPEGAVSPRADLASALAWMVVGAAIAAGSWRMDRLAHLNINPYEVPGLVPGLLGGLLFVLGAVLAVRAARAGGPRAGGERTAASSTRMALVLLAMLAYPLVLVGHGLPFWLVTGLFVTAFIYGFDRERQTALGRSTPRQLLLAATCGVATSAVVTLVFQNVFYVRLP